MKKEKVFELSMWFSLLILIILICFTAVYNADGNGEIKEVLITDEPLPGPEILKAGFGGLQELWLSEDGINAEPFYSSKKSAACNAWVDVWIKGCNEHDVNIGWDGDICSGSRCTHGPHCGVLLIEVAFVFSHGGSRTMTGTSFAHGEFSGGIGLLIPELCIGMGIKGHLVCLADEWGGPGLCGIKMDEAFAKVRPIDVGQ